MKPSISCLLLWTLLFPTQIHAQTKTSSYTCSGETLDKINGVVRSIAVDFAATHRPDVERAIVRFNDGGTTPMWMYAFSDCKSGGGNASCALPALDSQTKLPLDIRLIRIDSRVTITDRHNFGYGEIRCRSKQSPYEIVSVTYEGTVQNPIEVGAKIVLRDLNDAAVNLTYCRASFMSLNGTSLSGSVQYKDEDCKILPGPGEDEFTLSLTKAAHESPLKAGYHYLDTLWLYRKDQGHPDSLKAFGFDGFKVAE